MAVERHVHKERVFPASYVVTRDERDGLYKAFRFRDGVEIKGPRAADVINEAIRRSGADHFTPRTIFVRGDIDIHDTIRLESGTTLIIEGCLRAQKEGMKMIEVRSDDYWNPKGYCRILAGVVDLNWKAAVGIDLHGAVGDCVVKARVIRIPNDTFEEDDGSGLGPQTYPCAGIRIKGIYGVGASSKHLVEVATYYKGMAGDPMQGVGVYITSTTPDSPQRANGNYIIARDIRRCVKGVFVENGGFTTIKVQNISHCTYGIHIGANANYTTIIGSGYMEANEYAIYNEHVATLLGNIQFSGSTHGIYNLADIYIMGHVTDSWIHDIQKVWRFPVYPLFPLTSYRKSANPAVGTGDAYGDPVEFAPKGRSLFVHLARVVVSGIATGETVTVKLETVWDDGATSSAEIPFTSDGVVHVAGDSNWFALFSRDGHYIVKVRAYAKSDQASTAATATVYIVGLSF